ncbi:MAG: hypothetical protein ISR55_05445 [Bacteroidetes bacterium]|nr:hypothetical protein [Bacteroidota bacterium]
MPASSLKEYLANLVIRIRKRKQLNKSTQINYSKSRVIGIIYRRVNKTGASQVDEFIEKLKQDGKQVYSLEYIPKENDSDYQLKELNHFSLRDKDLNFLDIPKRVIHTNFCSKHFDMLINLSMANLAQLHYICALCSSSMKVGFYFDGYSTYYDLMVDAKGSLDFKEHLNTMFSFIKQINKN